MYNAATLFNTATITANQTQVCDLVTQPSLTDYMHVHYHASFNIKIAIYAGVVHLQMLIIVLFAIVLQQMHLSEFFYLFLVS